MGLDPSIILGAQNKQPDYLGVAGQALGLKNALIQNQGAQQQLDARNALGRIYSGAIDNGQLVPNKLTQGFADPNNAAAGYMAPDVFKQEQERESGQIGIDTSKYELIKKHIQTLQQAMAPLVANPNATSDDYVKSAANLVSQNLISPQEAMTALQGMPAGGAELHTWGLGHYTQLLDSDRQIDALYGKPQQTDTGASIQQGTESALTGYHPQGTFTKGLPPSVAAGTVATVKPDGTPGVISTGAYAAQNHIGQGEAYTPANGQPMSGGAASAPQAAPSRGFMATGLAPGQAEAMTDSAAQGQAAMKGASDFRLTMRPLLTEAKNMLAQGVLTGPNADTAKIAGQFMAQFPGVTVPDNTPRAEVLGKVLEQVSQRQLGILSERGAPTDAKLASAQTASPNTHLSNAGLADTIATVEGQGQAIDLLGQSYNAYLNSHPQSIVPFNQFKVQFAKDIDPYVLVLRSLPAADQQEAFKAMNAKQRAAIQASSDKLDKLAQAIGWKP